MYPEETTEVNVKLEVPGKFIYTYPKYPENGWNVTAHKNGDLIDRKGKKYYSLFWESIDNENQVLDDNTGFVVASEDLDDFFEEKLPKLGLNYKEA